MTDFTKPGYLKKGNRRQQRAYELLMKYQVFDILEKYSPVLAGTFPIEIDIEGSDLDIICHLDPDRDSLLLKELVAGKMVPEGTEITAKNIRINGEKAVVVRFMLEGLPVEIFGQHKPATEQNAYRHMMAEHRILQEKGAGFKQEIIELKKKGIKTEPAFGMLLGLENPYEDLLK